MTRDELQKNKWHAEQLIASIRCAVSAYQQVESPEHAEVFLNVAALFDIEFQRVRAEIRCEPGEEKYMESWPSLISEITGSRSRIVVYNEWYAQKNYRIVIK
jgi:hypothetical protein